MEHATISRLMAEAEGLFKDRDTSGALARTHEVLRLSPTFYWAHFLAGNIAEQAGDLAAAERAWRGAIATGNEAAPGAYASLLRHRFERRDFSSPDILAEALSVSETSSQARWYRSSLLFLSGIARLADGDPAGANTAMRAAFDYSRSIDEKELVWDWVAAAIDALADTAPFPVLRYLRRAAAARRTGVPYRKALEALPAGTHVLEIGAMDGIKFDSLRPFIVEHGWHAILVESTEDMFAELRANYAAYPNVKCIRAAISSETEEADAWCRAGSTLTAERMRGMPSASGHLLKFYRDPAAGERVAALTVRELARRENIHRIDVLQIDTEGFDWAILNQIDLAEWRIEVIHIEIVCLDPIDRLAVFSKLDAAGYAVHYNGNDVTAVRR